MEQAEPERAGHPGNIESVRACYILCVSHLQRQGKASIGHQMSGKFDSQHILRGIYSL